MIHDVVAVPGDGIGPEVVGAARRVVEATGVGVRWHEHDAGEAAAERHGTALPEATLAAVREAGAVLKGPMANVPGSPESPNIGLRWAADLTVNVRWARSFPGVPQAPEGLDLLVIRDVTEDVYSGPQHMLGPDAAMGVKFITRAATHRLARFAFEYARSHDRRRVTVAHKAGTLKKTDGLFLEAVGEVARDYPDIAFDDSLIDALVMHLVREPADYDVIVGTFQYGDILADLCAGLTGGLGLMCGASFGERTAFFEAAHGSAPKYAGKDKVNPTALILSAALMLEHLGERDAAAAVERAVHDVIADGTSVTYDLGGDAPTSVMTEAICAAVASGR